MPDFLENLTTDQLTAVKETEGPVRVIAGAGTGKTRTLTSRYCYLVDTLGIAPKNILCVTFTNRAANEMKYRIRKMLGDDLDLGFVCTIHAFCVQLLKEDANVLGFPRNFIVLDTEDEKNMLQKVFEDMHLTLRDVTIQRTIDEVLETMKMRADSYIQEFYLLDNEKLIDSFSNASSREEEIFLRYIYEQKKCFGLDFNDLINFTGYILDHYPDVRDKWQNRCEYVMVDEFQDVSAKQYGIAKALSGLHRNLFIVGDPDQTIYTWRGSHMKLFLDFDKEFKDAKTIVLSRNYRSVPEILTASDELISHNKLRYPKTLIAHRRPASELSVPVWFSDRDTGDIPEQCGDPGVYDTPDSEKIPDRYGRPVWYHAPNPKEEADWTAKMIRAYTSSGGKLSDIGILYRAHYLSRAIEEAFIKAKIPYTIYSGVAFYGRKEIKDVVCYLRMLTQADDVAFRRTVNLPARKIGRKKLEFLSNVADKHRISLYEALKLSLEDPEFRGTGAKRYVNAIETVRERMAEHRKVISFAMPFDRDHNFLTDILQQIMDLSGYEEYLRVQGDQERLDNIAEFKRSVAAAGEDPDMTLVEFLNEIALFTNLDKEEKQDTVKLMTVHTAKGMEYPVVFIMGLSEGIFPSRKVLMPEEMDEERRLMYVAMTRAKTYLALTDSEGIANDNLFKYPSRFIAECGEGNIIALNPPEKELTEKAKQFVATDEARLEKLSDLFAVGTRVLHEVFREGTIAAVDVKGGFYTIQFDNLPTQRNLRITAKLERIESRTPQRSCRAAHGAKHLP